MISRGKAFTSSSGVVEAACDARALLLCYYRSLATMTTMKKKKERIKKKKRRARVLLFSYRPPSITPTHSWRCYTASHYCATALGFYTHRHKY